MRKYGIIFAGCTLALAIIFLIYIHLNRQRDFSCESEYNLTEKINDSILRSQGLLSAELNNGHLLINLEGLLTSNGDKYIVSRTIAITLKKDTALNHLFYIANLQIIRHSADNTPDNIAQKNLFASQTNARIIYINHINDDTILLGTQTTPQYGCRRLQANNN